MKYSFIALLLLAGCAIQGEVYRLQERMRAWNGLLPREQKTLFAKNNSRELGAYLDGREAAEPEFAAKLQTLRGAEAIMAFDGAQTAHFFYHTLLKDLAKFSYGELIGQLSAEEFRLFLSKPDGSALAGLKKIEGVLAAARTHYGMEEFSDADILRYHRQISLPAHLYIVVYDTLAFAAKNGFYADVLEGKYEGLSSALDGFQKNARSRRPQTRRAAQGALDEWDYILSRAQAPSMAPAQFVQIIVEDVLPEMDADVRNLTLNNLETRFNIQPGG